jgi:uncharacterized membrane protein
MKKIVILCIIAAVLVITGCQTKDEKNEKSLVDNKPNKYLDANLDQSGDIIINTEEITEIATFINYKVDGITVQLIAVKASDGTVRIVFNTCQACNPDKNAFFVQDGNYLVCQTCKTRIKIDDIGYKGVGCSPFYVPDEYKKEQGNNIVISKSYVESFKQKFENWDGKLA